MSRRTIVSARSVSILRGISSPPWRTAKKSRTRARKKSSWISGNGKLITSFLRGGALAENTKIHSIRGTRSGLWWVTKASFQSSWTPWAEDNGDGSFSLFFFFSGNLAPERLSSWERLDPKEEEEEERRTERGKKTPVLWFWSWRPQEVVSRLGPKERVGGWVCYAAPGTNLDGVMSLRGLLFPLAFHIPFSFHSIP